MHQETAAADQRSKFGNTANHVSEQRSSKHAPYVTRVSPKGERGGRPAGDTVVHPWSLVGRVSTATDPIVQAWNATTAREPSVVTTQTLVVPLE